MEDDLGVLGRCLALERHLQQRGSAADAAQRVLDFVGQVADQFLVDLGLLQQPLLAFLAGLLLHRKQLDNHLVQTVRGRNDHMHRQAVGVVDAAQGRLVAQGRELVVLHTLQGMPQRLRIDKMIGQGVPLQAAARLPQRVFKGGVDRQHKTLCIEHRHRGGQQVKGGKTCDVHGLAEAAGRRMSSRCRLSMSRCDRSTAACSRATRSWYFCGFCASSGLRTGSP